MEQRREKVACGMAEAGLRLHRWRKLLRGRPTKRNDPPPCLVDGTMKMVRSWPENGQDRLGTAKRRLGNAEEQTWKCSREDLAALRIFHIGSAMKAARSGRRMVP
jgi:hypothetical protein